MAVFRRVPETGILSIMTGDQVPGSILTEEWPRRSWVAEYGAVMKYIIETVTSVTTGRQT
tara:strand:- start:1899 stop:2078 length:180 start_codon:yes stop_codon:yes gene_type:complete